MKKSFTLFLLLIFNISVSQQDTTNLKEVIVSTSKLEIPFSKNFRTVTVISSDYIKNSPALMFRIYYKKLQESMLEEEE